MTEPVIFAFALVAVAAAVRAMGALARWPPARRRALETLGAAHLGTSQGSVDGRARHSGTGRGPGGSRPGPAKIGRALLPAFVAARLRARTWRRALHAALPETADLLAVSMDAGLNVVLALRRVALHALEPVRSELDRANGEIALGRPLRDALGALADRTGSDEMRALVAILAGSDRIGSRVAASMGRWADDLWTRHRQELEAEARRAPVRILFPLVLLILPAFLLMTVVPLLLSTLRILGYRP